MKAFYIPAGIVLYVLLIAFVSTFSVVFPANVMTMLNLLSTIGLFVFMTFAFL
jgi:hypothetical protein